MASVAIALYILCWVPLVVITSIPALTELVGEDACGIIGVVILMLMVAAATALMVMKSYIRPVFLKGDKNEKQERINIKKRKNPVIKAISSGVWGVAFVSFMLMGFLGGLWHPGWLVFLIATAVDNIVEAIFEIVGKKYL
jgi:uncharacterized membrane protein